MAESAAATAGGARTIDEATLQSLNLKIDDNLDEYVVLVVGITDNFHLFENLPTMIKKDRIGAFSDMKACLPFIEPLHDANIFLITSGEQGQAHADELVSKSQIVSLYLYCFNEVVHKVWSSEIEKIRCVTSQPNKLIKKLHADIKERVGRWPIGEESFQQAAVSDSE